MTFIETLLDIQFPQTVKISPNNQQIVYSTTLSFGLSKGEHSRSTLWLAETGKAKSSRQLTSGLYNDHSPRWCPDGKTVAFVSDRAKQGESSAIYALPANGPGEAFALTPTETERSVTRFEFSPDGKFIAYLSADEKTAEKKAKEQEKDDARVWGEDWPFNRLRLVHVATKKVTTLVSRNANVVDMAWNDDGTKVAIAEARTPDIESLFMYGARISVVDLASKDVKEVCAFPNFIKTLTWAGDALFFSGPTDVEHLMSSCRIYTVDLKTQSPKFEACAHGEEDCGMALGKAGRDMVVRVEHGFEDQLRILNGKTLFSRKKEIKAWDAAFTKESDEMIIAVAQGDTNSPEEVFSTTASGGAMVQLSNHGEAVTSGKKLATATFLSCPSTDGEVEIDAVYLTPATSDGDKPHPTAVLIHGGPYGRNTDAFDGMHTLWTPILLAQGYGVLMPNYRGGSGRGEHFAAYARGGCGVYDYADVIALTQHAIEKGYADKERLVVGGWSQGGFLSYMCAVRNGLHGHGWKFRGAIPGAGITDGDTMALTSDIGAVGQAELAGKAPWDRYKSDIDGRTGSAIWEFKAAVEKGGVIPPMLMLHGEKDERVPLEQAVGFRRALEGAGLPFEFVVYPREGHLFKERRHYQDMWERVLGFVELHLGGSEE